MTSLVVKERLFRIGNQFGLHSLLRSGRKGTAVLYYHGVTPEIADPMVQSNQITFREFERQIQYLRENYEIISMDDLWRALAGGRSLHPAQAVITFDDGYRNNLTVAAPLLEAYGLPFCVFVSTRHIENGTRVPSYYLRAAVFANPRPVLRLRSLGLTLDISNRSLQQKAYRRLAAAVKRLPMEQVRTVVEEVRGLMPEPLWQELDHRFDSEKLMTWQEVEQIRRMGATIGSHCHDHCILHSLQPAVEVTGQLQESKKLIEGRLGECGYFAFPNGTREDISPEAYRALGQNGYRLAFTTMQGEVLPDCDAFLVPRIAAVNSFEDFQYRLLTAWRRQASHKMVCSEFSSLPGGDNDN